MELIDTCFRTTKTQQVIRDNVNYLWKIGLSRINVSRINVNNNKKDIDM